jgi:hypothetical protein
VFGSGSGPIKGSTGFIGVPVCGSKNVFSNPGCGVIDCLLKGLPVSYN